MKKFLTFLLAAVLVISLTACGKDDAIATVQEPVSYTHLDVYKRQNFIR